MSKTIHTELYTKLPTLNCQMKITSQPTTTTVL